MTFFYLEAVLVEDIRNRKVEELYERHHREVFVYIRTAFEFERSVIQELTNEVFIRIWQSPRVDLDRIERAYVYAVARAVSVDHIRYGHRSRRDQRLTLRLDDALSAGALLYAKEAPADEDSVLEGLLQRLPQREREVLLLCASDLSIEQAAGVMNLSRLQAKYIRAKGLQRLKRWLSQSGNLGGLEQNEY
jgi:RNA polymerase sigma factor (sigma-70 family)